MRRFGLNWFALVLGVALSASAATNDAPDFKQVFDLIRTHLKGATDTSLNQAAVEGLLSSLRGKVSVVGGEQPKTQTNSPALAKSSALEGDVAYVRIARVDDEVAQDIGAAMKSLAATNKLSGLVLDLRFAEGEDYAAAAAVADLFQTKAKPLLDWGEGAVSSKEKSDAIKMPVAVLVNRETGGAGEALAAIMRETGGGLILGSATTGRAMIGQEFPLKNGQRLRIATSPVKLGDGTPLSPQGLKPDIEVAVSPEDERNYLGDPYVSLTKTSAPAAGLSLTNQPGGTNRPGRRPRPSEADLVRARREGTNLDAETLSSRPAEPEKPLIRDPALARSVDLIKALAVVRQARP